MAQLLFIHGGCWLNHFDVSHSRAACKSFAAAGFTVWSMEYRRIGDDGGGWPGTFADAEAALASMAQHQSMHPLPVLVAGHSAGGQLALWLGATSLASRLSVAGVLGLAAICDLHKYSQGTSDCEQAVAMLLGGGPDTRPDRYASTSPACLELHPHTYIIHGGADAIVPVSQLQSLPAATADRTQVLDDVGHFDLVHPATTAFAVVLDTMEKMANATR